MSVTVWRGIRFATAERFRAPELVPLEQVPEPGGSFGPAPIQPAGFDLGAPTSEDCHFLNVWAPAGATTLPVLLYFYGGGFERGAASLDFLDGEALAAEVGCIVVTANHRVGALGFASLAHRGGALSDATNLGVRDARASTPSAAAATRLGSPAPALAPPTTNGDATPVPTTEGSSPVKKRKEKSSAREGGASKRQKGTYLTSPPIPATPPSTTYS